MATQNDGNSITLRGVSNLPIGTLSVGVQDVKVTFSNVREGRNQILLRKDAIKRAEVVRVGRISANTYALRLFLEFEECKRLGEAVHGMLLEPKPGVVIGPEKFTNVTGEYVDFLVDSFDVFGYDQQGASKSRQIIDALLDKP